MPDSSRHADAPPGQAAPGPVDFPLQPYRRPVRISEVAGMVLLALLAFLWLSGAFLYWARAPRWVALPIGGLAALAVPLWWWRTDHRRYPAGSLRLDAAGLTLNDGLGRREQGYGELRYLFGGVLGLTLRLRQGKVLIDWPRFAPRAPREVVQALVERIAAQPGGAQVLQQTMAQTRRAVRLGQTLLLIAVTGAVLAGLRLLLLRIGER